MPRPEHCYKTALYGQSVEAGDWAASLHRPDATGQQEALMSPNPHHQQVTLERSESHAHRGEVLCLLEYLTSYSLYTSSSMNSLRTADVVSALACSTQNKDCLPDSDSGLAEQTGILFILGFFNF